jgi:hypothetical protein
VASEGSSPAPPGEPPAPEEAPASEHGEVSRATLHEIVLGPQEREPQDPFVGAVLRQLGEETLATFTEEQRRRLERALFACRPLQGHPIDIRGVIPLFFMRFYYVLLVGRDRRRGTSRAEHDRRRAAGVVTDAIFVLCLLWQGLVVVGLGLYLLKSAVGIDLIKDRHAWELLLD